MFARLANNQVWAFTAKYLQNHFSITNDYCTGQYRVALGPKEVKTNIVLSNRGSSRHKEDPRALW